MGLNNTSFRAQIHRVVFRSDTRAGRLFDVVLLWLIIFSILSVILDSVNAFRARYLPYIQTVEWIFTIAFTIEYILRVYSATKPKKYIFSFYGLIDLLAFVPTYLSLIFTGAQYFMVVRAFRLLRVFRILKLSRHLNESNILVNALKSSRFKITVFLASVLTLVTIIGTLMYLIEGNSSGFTSIPASIYWAIVTITTVGYGDIAPQTTLGQILASLLMIIGYGIIAVPTGIVSVELARATEESKKRCTECNGIVHSSDARYCSYCGHPLEGYLPEP